MKLKDVLEGPTDPQQLAEVLWEVDKAGNKLELEAAGLQRLVGELHQAGEGTGYERLQLASRLLRVTVSKAELSNAHQRALVQSKYGPALARLAERGTQAVRAAPAQPPPRLDLAISTIFNAMADLATYFAGQPSGGGKAPRGREVHGATLVPPIAAYLAQPAAPGAWEESRHCASGALLEFLVNCRPNCHLLATPPDFATTLFGSVLHGCGDAALQFDLLEAAYRCARAGALRQHHRALLAPALLAGLDELAERGVGAGGIDLAVELRRLLPELNRSQGRQASLHSLQAARISVCGLDNMAAPGMWVDFGLSAMTVGLCIPEAVSSGKGEEADAAAAELELVPFAYGDIARTQVSAAADGQDRVTFFLKAMPEALQSMTQTFKGTGTLVLYLKRSVLVAMKTGAPRVATAMQAAGVVFTPDSAPDPGPDMSQPTRKCSIGFTVYDKAEAAAGGRSTGRKPLAFTRSGPPSTTTSLHEAQQAQQTVGALDRNGASLLPLLLQSRQHTSDVMAAPDAAPGSKLAELAQHEKGEVQQGQPVEERKRGQHGDEERAQSKEKARAEEAGHDVQHPASHSPAQEPGQPARRHQPPSRPPLAPSAGTASAGTCTGATATAPAAAAPSTLAVRTASQSLAGRPATTTRSPSAPAGEGEGVNLRPSNKTEAQNGADAQPVRRPTGPEQKPVGKTVGTSTARPSAEQPAGKGSRSSEQPDDGRSDGAPAAGLIKDAAETKQTKPATAGKQTKQPKAAMGKKSGKAAHVQPVWRGSKGRQQPKGQPRSQQEEDKIEETGPSAEPAPKPAAYPNASSEEEDSDVQESSPSPSNSELLHDHASRQPLQTAAAAAKARAAAAGKATRAALRAQPEEDERAQYATGPAEQPPAKNNQGRKAAEKLNGNNAPVMGGRPRRAAAALATARLAANPDSTRAPAAPAAGQAMKGQQGPAGASGRRQVKSPFKARRVLGADGMLGTGKRSRETEKGLEASGRAGSPVAVAGAMLDAEDREELSPVAVDAADSDEPLLAQPYEQLPSPIQPASSSSGDDQGEEGREEMPSGQEEQEEQWAPALAAGYLSTQPGRDVPDMSVDADGLRSITKRFKFTAFKEPTAEPASTGRRRKAEIKAAAGVAKMKGPELLLGLSGAKLGAKAKRVTTVLGQEGLGPGSTTRHTPADPRKKQLQQYQQRQQEQSSSGKRKLEALGLASAKKRQKGEGAAGKVAAPKPPAEIGTCGRSARAAVTGADVAAHAASGGVEDAGPETSQAPSIHKLLHSVKRRQAVASHQSEPDSDEEDGDDMAALHAFMVEVVRKRKAAAQRKQSAMVAELEAEVAAMIGSKHKEMQQARKHLNEAVGRKFGVLERQLEGKMKDINDATLAFQERLNSLWEEYRTLFDRMAGTAAEAEAAATEQQAATAASLESMRAGMAARAADVARKVERGSRKASKMPELAQMLMPFLD